MSPPPQAPGPIRRGIGSTAATLSSRRRQSDGWLVTSAELKSGPAASRNVSGSIQTGGRGRGSGTSSAAATPQPKTASKTMARSARTGRDVGHDCGIYAGLFPITRPLRPPVRPLTLAPAGEGRRPKRRA